MTRKFRAFTTASAFALCAALLGAFSSIADAASISYGNFGPVPPATTFLNVTESSGTDPVPLYGPPTPFTTGLDFDPANFVATSAGGGADVTDGQVSFTVMAPQINSVSLTEAGDYTLVGFGTTATSVFAGASIRGTVTQINGVNVAPILLTPSNASVGFNLVANPGVLQPWSLGTTLNVAGQLGPGQIATKVEIVIDNQMVAISQPTSVAFIAKKEFIIRTDTEIPEPSTIALAGLALCGMGVTASRRRG
jgi:hypothetical protein